jgi:tripartite-type tricarboxylate transporter receptor subunit TctC
MSEAVALVCKDPEVITTMEKLSLEPLGNTPEEVAEIIRQELPVYAAAVEAAGLRRK